MAHPRPPPGPRLMRALEIIGGTTAFLVLLALPFIVLEILL